MESPIGLLVIFVKQSILINLILAAFNMLPIPPLDGAHALSALLPRAMGEAFDAQVGRYGTFALLVLLLPIIDGVSPMSYILLPARLAAGFFLGAPFSAWALPPLAG